MRVIKLFWFKDKTNVGDIISYFIVHYMTHCDIRYSTPKLSSKFFIKKAIRYAFGGEAIPPMYNNFFSDYIFPFQKCLVAIGSLLDYTNNKCLIWGTGFRGYSSYYRGGTVYAVRGKLSREKLPTKYRDVPIGDPAILLPLIYPGKKGTNPNKIVIIPHYYDYDDLFKRFSNRYDFLDVRTTDVGGFINKLLNYDYVLSTSLHGLIISHSYGIRAIWIHNGDIGTDSFKFHDYFSSVEIPKYDGFRDLNTILENESSWLSFFQMYKRYSLPQIDIRSLQNGLIKSFPYKAK